jgi:AraC-like DNA-binding protein
LRFCAATSPACHPAGGQGWFAAINDPIVSRALQLVHADPGKRWTAESLAREAGSSRTVLAERFNALLGRPPIDYVTSWRIQLAAENLRGTDASIRKVAADVGYESEAAFNRAFKRVTGTTPGRWREGISPDPFAQNTSATNIPAKGLPAGIAPAGR